LPVGTSPKSPEAIGASEVVVVVVDVAERVVVELVEATQREVVVVGVAAAR